VTTSGPAGPGPELVVQAGSNHLVRDVQFSPDGRQLAIVSVDGLLRVVDLHMGKEWRTYNGAAGPLHVTAWSPDGRQIAAAGFDKSVHIWDVATGAEIATLPGHSGWVMSLEYSPDGRYLASAAGTMDAVVAVWDVEQKRLRHALQHAEVVHDLAWSRDGKALVTASKDVAVWNMENGGRLGEIAVDPHGAGKRKLRFSPDGKLLAIDGVGELVHLYDAGSWAEAARLTGSTLIGWHGPDGSIGRAPPRRGHPRRSAQRPARRLQPLDRDLDGPRRGRAQGRARARWPPRRDDRRDGGEALRRRHRRPRAHHREHLREARRRAPLPTPPSCCTSPGARTPR
jgi:uncharacterized protein with WD repeat